MFSLYIYIVGTGSSAPRRAGEGGDVCFLYIYIVGTGSPAPGRAGEGGDVCSLLR